MGVKNCVLWLRLGDKNLGCFRGFILGYFYLGWFLYKCFKGILVFNGVKEWKCREEGSGERGDRIGYG